MRAKWVLQSILFWWFCILLYPPQVVLCPSRVLLGILKFSKEGRFVKNNTIHIQNKMCGPGQEYSDCQTCEKTCSNPHPMCNGSCIAGCFCKSGLLRSPSGQCVELKLCPAAQVTMADNDLTIEECLSDEVFVWCGLCEGTCKEPKPYCPNICTRGCVCRPPLLRHFSGHCVEESACTPKRCLDPNEEYGCRYGCEATCTSRLCVRPRRCRLGCHCKLGWYKDNQGKCVTHDQCLQQSNITQNL